MRLMSKYAAVCLLGTILPFSAIAADAKYEIDLRGNALLGDGVPANDIIGYGIGGRSYLRDGWFVGAAIEAYEFDFERPINVVGLSQDPAVKVIDATTTTTVVSASLGRTFDWGNSNFDWFWSLGIGAGFPDVKNATGPLSTGGTFDVRTDASTEFQLMGKLGLSYEIARNWSARAVARAEHHFMDYKVTELNTGATGSVSSQSPLGMHVSLNYRF